MGAQGCDDVFAIHEGCRKRKPVARPEFPGFAMPRRLLNMRDSSQSLAATRDDLLRGQFIAAIPPIIAYPPYPP
jgi:hypothetical protein